MENQLFVIYDKVAQRYMIAHVFSNEKDANRTLPAAIVKQFGTLSDYELCHVGSIDVESGIVKSFPPVRVAWKSPALSSVPPAVQQPVNSQEVNQ